MEIKIMHNVKKPINHKIFSTDKIMAFFLLIFLICAVVRVVTLILFKSGLTSGAIQVPLLSKYLCILNPEAAIAAVAIAFFALPERRKIHWILLGFSGFGYAFFKAFLGSKAGGYDFILWIAFAFFTVDRKVLVRPKTVMFVCFGLATLSVVLFYLGFLFRIATLNSFKDENHIETEFSFGRYVRCLSTFNYSRSYLGQDNLSPIQTAQVFGSQVIQRFNLLDAPLVVFLRPEVNPSFYLNWTNTYQSVVNAIMPGKPFPEVLLSEYGIAVCYQDYSATSATFSQQADNWSFFGLSYVYGKGWGGGLFILWGVYLFFALCSYLSTSRLGGWLYLLFAPMIYNAFYYTYIGFGFDNVVARSFNLFIFNLILVPMAYFLSRKVPSARLSVSS
jgi:hypothetical protein